MKNIVLPIVFQNEHFVIVDKPAGWLTVPPRFKTDERACVGTHLEKQLSCRLWPVHRLDYEVSGLVVFAKTSEAQRILSQCLEKNEVEKRYEVWSTGSASFSDLILPSHWILNLAEGKKRTFEAGHGKVSKTVLLERKAIEVQKQKLTRWIVKIETGRRHQIRATFAKKGHPVLGDLLYGGDPLPKSFEKENFICLRAVFLAFRNEEKLQALGLPKEVVVPGIESLLS